MTSFLAFIMSSVRISSDIPNQSEYLPLITLYFLLSILYTFIGFMWFDFIHFISLFLNKFLKFIEFFNENKGLLLWRH